MKKNILMVDDNPINIMMFAEALQEEGYGVFVATNGLEALECAARGGESRPDLVLLDIVMPGIDGYETCRRLKAGEATRDIPVVFMTGFESKGIEFIMSIGAVDCLVKPFDYDFLLNKISEHIK